jgi:DNA-binding transcriptional MerR regulator
MLMLSIGELAKRTNTSVRSLRHYEQCGLLNATRKQNGYRYFDVAAIEYVSRIRELLRVGFSLEEIRPVVSMREPEQRSRRLVCADVIELYQRKLGELDQRIADLQTIHAHAAGRLSFLQEQRRQGGPTEVETNAASMR